MNEKQRVESLLKQYGYAAKKSFGQNFLINEGIIRKIVTSMAPEKYETTIEIGPGLGALTIPLSQKANKLYAVDADREMIHVLQDIFTEDKKVNLIQSDFLKFDADSVSDPQNRMFIGNLPYNITSELFEYFLRTGFSVCGAMVQKEVADKLTYVPNKKENSPLGAFIACTGELTLVTDVDRSCFSPSPKVDSAFIKIEQKEKIDFRLYPYFKAFFKDPNKTISNCLKQYPKYTTSLEALKKENCELLSLRARQLEKEDILALARRMLVMQEATE